MSKLFLVEVKFVDYMNVLTYVSTVVLLVTFSNMFEGKVVDLLFRTLYIRLCFVYYSVFLFDIMSFNVNGPDFLHNILMNTSFSETDIKKKNNSNNNEQMDIDGSEDYSI